MRWSHWVGGRRSAALNNLLASLSKGVRELPASTRQDIEDKLPIQKVESLPRPCLAPPQEEGRNYKVPPHAFTGPGRGTENQYPAQPPLKSWRQEVFFLLMSKYRVWHK